MGAILRAAASLPRKVLFWDFDGTLAYRPGLWGSALSAVLAEHAPEFRIDTSTLAASLRNGFPWHTPELGHEELVTAEAWWARLCSHALVPAYRALGLPREAAEELAPKVRGKFLAPADWIVFEDTVPALTDLSGLGWSHFVVSNHVPELEDLAKALGLSPFLEGVVTSALVGYEKPHPKIFEAALQAAGPIEAAWMIGDHFEVDVLGAQAVGLPAILVRHEHADVQ
ncbi:MAG: HAD-IA family hydrolase [Betaproteobacteria bacterium]|nr:HAD-IA family hydrolase [Betaproteobacteria bacterium]